MDKFREEVRQESDAAIKKKASLDPSSRGYGGKFGVESDRMDKSALGKDLNLLTNNEYGTPNKIITMKIGLLREGSEGITYLP